MKENGDIVLFSKQKDYIMVNKNLGEGSFGKTVVIKDPFIEELFVAKKYEPEYDAIKEKFYKNFLDEIKIMYKLNHPNIVRIYNYYAFNEKFVGYIIMEYINGDSIEKWIENCDNGLCTTSIDEIFIQLINAFTYLEENKVVHRDIRESNILVDENDQVKIIDFGIGKLMESKCDNSDSLYQVINRNGSDTLPNEYHNGVYTSKTDMFYLGELLNRLINGCSNLRFSHYSILNKMMNKNPNDRYTNFSEVKEVIGKYDFLNMKISPIDKQIYQSFTNEIFNAISSYSEEPRFNSDTSIFMARLENALKDNLFEDNIQKNSEVIDSIVSCQYKYYPKTDIKCTVVENFLNWYKRTTIRSQELILSNIISKISEIKIEIDESELDFPF